MLVTHQERPRELKWYHAGPLLYGDWGTSRFYVLGLALAFSLHASFWYVLAVGLIVAAVGWAYTIICRCYPDGGGVYSAARHTSRSLAVVGALLLFADYIVTASMSACDGMRYMGIEPKAAAYWAMAAIFLIGVVNYIGPRRAGTVALIITLATIVLTMIVTAFCLPGIPKGIQAIHRPMGPIGHQWNSFVYVILALSGVEAIANMTGIMVPPVARTSKKAIWPVLVEVVLFNIILGIAMNALPMGDHPPEAYKRVEAIREQYHLPAPSTAENTHNADTADWRTDGDARAAITAAARDYEMSPDQFAALQRTPEQAKFHKDAEDSVMRVMAEHFVGNALGYKIGQWAGVICGIVFGLLLVSAANTAIADMISIQYVMSRDTELPRFLTRLNVFGVPWLALIPAVTIPILLLTVFQDIDQLASLYAIGVVGAIAINLGSCSIHKDMPLKRYERICMFLLAILMTGIEITLAWDKPPARIFAGCVVAGGLLMRFSTKTYPKLSIIGKAIALASAAVLLMTATILIAVQRDYLATMLLTLMPLLHSPQTALLVLFGAAALLLLGAGSFASHAVVFLRRGLARVPVTTAEGMPGMLPAPIGPVTAAETGTVLGEAEIDRPHVLVATRGGRPLLEFAADYARDIHGILFVLYVRQIQVAFAGPVKGLTLEEDPAARSVFATAAEVAKRRGVAMVPIYVVSPDVAYSILDFAATYNAKALLMGVSRKGTLLRALQGDVITNVADNLPNDIPLLIHA